MTVAIITRDNGKGLTRDQQIFAECFRGAGCEVRLIGIDERPPSVPVADLAVFLELYDPKFSRVAHRTILVPNQEWWPVSFNRYLPLIDFVWAKTRHAEEIYRRLGCETIYAGMTSVNAGLDFTEPSDPYCLHVPGNSANKGTGAVVDAWRISPEWPTLIVVSHGLEFEHVPENVQIIREKVDEVELRMLQNGALLNIHPSECEGWGHAIAESMSAGVPVVTVAAPPMYELVTPSRGYLCPWRESIPEASGARFFATGETLKPVIDAALADPIGREERGRRARMWWHANDKRFRTRIHSLIYDLCTSELTPTTPE